MYLGREPGVVVVSLLDPGLPSVILSGFAYLVFELFHGLDPSVY